MTGARVAGLGPLQSVATGVLPRATLSADALATGRDRIDTVVWTGVVIALLQLVFLAVQQAMGLFSLRSFILFTFSNLVLLVVSGAMVALLRSRATDRQAWWLSLAYGFTVVSGFAFGTQHLSIVAHGGIDSGAAPGFAIIAFALIVPMTPRVALVAMATVLPIIPLSAITAGLYNGALPGGADLFRCMYTSMYACLIGFVGARFVFQLSRAAAEARQLGSYTLERRLGAGGMGEVWKARHALLRRPAAVKFIKGTALEGLTPPERERLLSRFEQEAQATGRLLSPHSIQLYDFGQDEDGGFYFVMELLDGSDLERFVREHGPMPPERVARLLIQICDSLGDAHDQGLVHRDIKPANLFLCRRGRDVDFAKVLDFGIVGVRTEDGGQQDLALGTPAYLAPETVQRLPADGRTDLYSLGAVAFYLLTGRRVFTQNTPASVVAAHLRQTPDRPSVHAPNPVPTVLDDLVVQCLAKDPAERPASATELARRLEASGLPQRWTAERAAAWWAKLGAPSVDATSPVLTHRAPTFLISGSVVQLPEDADAS